MQNKENHPCKNILLKWIWNYTNIIKMLYNIYMRDKLPQKYNIFEHTFSYSFWFVIAFLVFYRSYFEAICVNCVVFFEFGVTESTYKYICVYKERKNIHYYCCCCCCWNGFKEISLLIPSVLKSQIKGIKESKRLFFLNANKKFSKVSHIHIPLRQKKTYHKNKNTMLTQQLVLRQMLLSQIHMPVSYTLK